MIELQGNMWDTKFDSWIKCITTNGTVRKDGALVMGRGNAFYAKIKYPELALMLGGRVKSDGIRLEYISNYRLVAFPVKYEWSEKASLLLIAKSCVDLCDLVRGQEFKNVLLPRPGCGNGELDWEEDVKPLIEPIINALAPKIVIITR